MEGKIKAGKEHFAAGRLEEAERCFAEIRKSNPDNKEACNNLGVIAFQQGEAGKALQLFSKALELDPYYRDALLNFAELSGKAKQPKIAITGLKAYLQDNPQDRQVRDMLGRLESPNVPRLKIAVLCLPGLESFLGEIVRFLGSKHEVKCCSNGNEGEIKTVVDWADTVWLEWANELAVTLTNHQTLLHDKRVICRLHSYEAFAGYLQQIQWERIDDLIFVAEHIKSFVTGQHPEIEKQVGAIHVIANGVNLEKFPFKERTPGRNIAFLGNVNYKKGPMLLLHAFRELVAYDDSYRLFIGGNFQDARYALYFGQMAQELNLQRNLVLDGWVDDVPAWLEDKQYIACSSVLEGHPVGLMEAMARGLKPLIHNFVGARGIYPDKYIWNTVHDFVRLVTEPEYKSSEYRDFIARNFSLEKQMQKIEQIISHHVIHNVSNL